MSNDDSRMRLAMLDGLRSSSSTSELSISVTYYEGEVPLSPVEASRPQTLAQFFGCFHGLQTLGLRFLPKMLLVPEDIERHERHRATRTGATMIPASWHLQQLSTNGASRLLRSLSISDAKIAASTFASIMKGFPHVTRLNLCKVCLVQRADWIMVLPRITTKLQLQKLELALLGVYYNDNWNARDITFDFSGRKIYRMNICATGLAAQTPTG